jgi:hypothetical protein
MKPEVRKFSKREPCTKRHLWNAFKGRRGFKRLQVDVAHSLVGVNAPRYMLKLGYLNKVSTANVDYYLVTADGADWLVAGIKSYVKNHPDRVNDIDNLTQALMPK